jgi:hypothetical protein
MKAAACGDPLRPERKMRASARMVAYHREPVAHAFEGSTDKPLK